MRIMILPALAAVAVFLTGCVTVYTTVLQFNGDSAVARGTNVVGSAYSRALATLTTTNGTTRTEVEAGGGIVTTVNVNSTKSIPTTTDLEIPFLK